MDVAKCTIPAESRQSPIHDGHDQHEGTTGVARLDGKGVVLFDDFYAILLPAAQGAEPPAEGVLLADTEPSVVWSLAPYLWAPILTRAAR